MYCVLSQNFCISLRNFAFPRNTFVFPHKYICILSQNFCVLSRNFALPRKTLAFSLPVQQFLFTLCFQWFRQLHTFIMEQFIEFYFELGLKYKEIQSVLSTRHGFDISDRQLKMILRKKRIVSTEKLLGLSGPCWFHQSSAAVLWATSWVPMDVHEMQREGSACEKIGCTHGAEGIGSCRSFNEESQMPQMAQLLC